MNIKKILETIIFRNICEYYQYNLDDTDYIKSYIYQTALDDENVFSFQMVIKDRAGTAWNVKGIIVDGLIIIRSRD